MLIDWPVKVRWPRLRPVLLIPTLPFYALRAVARRLCGGELPGLVRVLLFPFALIFLGLPTRLYELAGIVTVLDETEAN